ncbi:MAG: calcium-translocating P-type ATPase, PMCA-type [Clostridia bacterium]|nr:calcium-translocating P-type ATPase, PMCA-type [Clostridia bacterium]
MRGLNEKEVELSRKKHGANTLESYKRKNFFKVFLSNLSDPIIKVLIIALFINIVFMFPNVNWFETGGIAASIFIATLVSTLSEFTSDNAFEKLREQGSGAKCRVIRNEGILEIAPEEIVCDDIIVINAGEKIPADSILLEGEVKLDESVLTGESKEITKNASDEKSKKLLRGALVLSGTAYARVNAVGKNTYYGKIAQTLTEDTRPSPLKHRLGALAKSISILGYVAAALIALAYLFNAFCIDSKMDSALISQKLHDPKFVFSELLNALTLAVSVIVVAVPEGLPMMITVVLSSNMKKMMSQGVVVRKMVGIETSGNINLLFTDKTGTLTEGKLKVKQIISPNGEKYSNINSIKNEKYKKYLTLCAKFCNDSVYNGKRAIGSNSTDRAICEFVKNSECEATVAQRIPFDSSKKYSCATVLYEKEKYTLIKGAPEKILEASNSYINENGCVCQMERHEGYLKLLKELASLSYRVVALGIKEQKHDTSLAGITLLGFVAIRDKIRKEVPKAIKEVSEAGVGVIMITGDNRDTAEAIAKECGIISAYSKRKNIITADAISKMSDEEIETLLPTLAVIARALPSDKTRIVKLAQRSGYVVGMTGDGINDAASLKMADVGFSMGSGTDVAKEASDIVISDNNFASIVRAILYGRTVFDSIRKFIVFQLTMNLAAVGISLIGPFIGIEKPVTVTQMLWVNIIMDTLGALAFASEPNDKSYMKQKPLPRDEKIISSDMMQKIILNGVFVLTLCIWFLKSDTVSMILLRGDEKYLLSAFFAMFIFTGVFVCFTSRTPRLNIMANISKNRSFIIIMLLISVLQMVFIYFGGDTFRATPLYFEDLLKIIAISFAIVIFDFIRKLLSKFSKIKNTSKIEYKKEQTHIV